MDTTPPAHRTPGCLLQLLPALTASQHSCLSVSAPCGPGSSPLSLSLWCGQSNPGSSPLSLPLWIPGHSLPADAAARPPEGVANPTFDPPFCLFPCGFQVTACLLMLLPGFLRVWPVQPCPSFSSPVVWPIQPHFLPFVPVLNLRIIPPPRWPSGQASA